MSFSELRDRMRTALNNARTDLTPFTEAEQEFDDLVDQGYAAGMTATQVFEAILYGLGHDLT